VSRRQVGNSTGNSDADAQALQREALAFSLRIQGFDFDTIAARCGYGSRASAYKAYKRAISRIPNRTIEEMRETIFAQQMHALSSMAFKIAHGDTFAVKEMTAIHDRMAKLFGLDTPVVTEMVPSAQVIVRAYPPEWINALPSATPHVESVV
jgi:hypothetical protein